MERSIEKLNSELENRLNAFEDNVSEYMENLKKKDEFYSVGPFAQKMIPMFKNPSFRLKFLGKITVIERSNEKNPEVEGDFK